MQSEVHPCEFWLTHQLVASKKYLQKIIKQISTNLNPFCNMVDLKQKKFKCYYTGNHHY